MKSYLAHPLKIVARPALWLATVALLATPAFGAPLSEANINGAPLNATQRSERMIFQFQATSETPVTGNQVKPGKTKGLKMQKTAPAPLPVGSVYYFDASRNTSQTVIAAGQEIKGADSESFTSPLPLPGKGEEIYFTAQPRVANTQKYSAANLKGLPSVRLTSAGGDVDVSFSLFNNWPAKYDNDQSVRIPRGHEIEVTFKIDKIHNQCDLTITDKTDPSATTTFQNIPMTNWDLAVRDQFVFYGFKIGAAIPHGVRAKPLPAGTQAPPATSQAPNPNGANELAGALASSLLGVNRPPQGLPILPAGSTYYKPLNEVVVIAGIPIQGLAQESFTAAMPAMPSKPGEELYFASNPRLPDGRYTAENFAGQPSVKFTCSDGKTVEVHYSLVNDYLLKNEHDVAVRFARTDQVEVTFNVDRAARTYDIILDNKTDPQKSAHVAGIPLVGWDAAVANQWVVYGLKLSR